MGCREGDSVLSQQWLHRTYEPSLRTSGVSSNERNWTVPMIPTIEHAWVLETAGSQLITARSEHVMLHHDARIRPTEVPLRDMSEHRFRSLINA